MRAAARAADMNLRGSLIELDIEQDGARAPILREIVEAIAEIDVDLVAQRYDAGKTHVALRTPFEQRGRDRTGLRNQGEVAQPRRSRREAGIELCLWRDDAETVRPDDPQPIFAGCPRDQIFRGSGAAIKAGGNNDRHAAAQPPGLVDKPGHRGLRRSDDHHIDGAPDRGERRHARAAFDLPVMGIDEVQRPRKAAIVQVRQQRLAQRTLARTGADQGDRARFEEVFEAVGAHLRVPDPSR